MGRIKVDTSNILKPKGIESLGDATNNICEQALMFHSANHLDFGQRIPSTNKWSYVDPPGLGEKRHGQGFTDNVECLYLKRHTERTRLHARSRTDEGIRRREVITRRKIKKANKKALKVLKK